MPRPRACSHASESQHLPLAICRRQPSFITASNPLTHQAHPIIIRRRAFHCEEAAKTTIASPTTSIKPDDQPLNNGAPPPAPSPTPVPTPPTTSGSAVREPSSPDALDPTGFHTDGRVRNPVPTKLQGMTNSRNGNFAVMHIDLTGSKPTDRNAAAKRTSEETEAQARRANQAGWQPVRRSKLVWHGDDTDLQTARTSDPASTPPSRIAVPAAAPAAATDAAAAAAAAPSSTSTSEWLQTRTPTPQETKAEQARLLTLLRTLHPILVVEQLCKALAYFGGIPGAPPPTDGSFPQSVLTNSSGSLLVNWLGEIFPPVDDPAAMADSLHLPPLSSVAGDTTGWDRQEASPVPVRRARGRPKGSKSSKVRRDKGMKKSRPAPSVAVPEAHPQPMLAGQDLGHGFSAANQPEPSAISQVALLTGAPPKSQVNPDASMTSTPGQRKRGRPKGSKNRPKENAVKKHSESGSKAPGATQTQNFGSPLPRASTMFPGAPALAEEGPNGSVTGLVGSAVRTDSSLPVAAAVADASALPENGPTPPLYATPFYSQGPHPGQGSPQNSGIGPNTTSHPRTMKRPVLHGSQASLDGPASQGYTTSQSTGSIHQDHLAKRRRISKDKGHQQGGGIDSQGFQMSGGYVAQRPAQMSPQMIYTPQQSPMSNQLGSLGHHSTNLGRSMSGPHHYPQNMGRSNSGGSGTPSMSHQRGMAAMRGHQHRGKSHGFHSQHQQATSQPNAMGTFHSYGEQSYLNMDYGLTERDVQDAAAVTALGSPSQLEAALSQAKMRDQHMFQSIGR
ncbi:hypothetical protein CP533_4147 [Ophiocordyceps camponoti-saundersi (nom. inval.)]|nr:hypothetical protein CP533_4147 [Ophiocordyceps camponoti-saundersi (nom. inval.)]